MGSNISLFSGYNQRENRTTNYILLILKMLYEENPKFLAEILVSLIDEEMSDIVGVKFTQQLRRKTSTPDGLIHQEPFTIYVETKHFDWFYDDQLERHLEELDKSGPGKKILVALSRFDLPTTKRFERIKNICASKYRDIIFAALSFEDFLEALKLLTLPKNLEDTMRDFQAYLDQEELLSNWRNFLDVVNCASTRQVVLEGRVYMCPTAGGNYSHARCKYFGLYSEKRVEYVAEIRAVVDVEGETESNVKWKNVEVDDMTLNTEARASLNKFRHGEYPKRVFLLGDLFQTDFAKETKGGMWVSKQYFDVSSLKIKTAEELAEALRGKKWADLKTN
jgi:hypothetical protein